MKQNHPFSESLYKHKICSTSPSYTCIHLNGTVHGVPNIDKMKFFVAVAALCLTIVSAEPPVSGYLPPGRGGGGRPSSTYGAPSTQFSAPSAPSSQYGAPSAPSSQYGAPNAPSSQYGAPNNAPSSQYGAPNANAGQTQAVFGSRPSSSYSAPRPSQNYGPPSNQYLPANNGGNGGYPAARGGGEDYNSEPANYNFEYMVKDEKSGNDFGHKESRQGDRTEGEYFVLLPDGRKQIVKYEADENGYRPKITYEDVGVAGGYGRGPANDGYSGGGYPSGPY